MSEPQPTIDDLIPRLRERAADPARRTTHRPTQFSRDVGGLGLGGMLSLGRSLAADLGRVVGANQTGGVDALGAARAEDVHRAMTTPADRDLPLPADEATLGAAEAALGVRFPNALRRAYAEVADGGFGPGEGLLPVREIVRAWEELTRPGALPRGRTWPAGLIPAGRVDPGYECVEATTGRVISWDPDGLSERSGEAAFQRSFREVAGSVESWLNAWLSERTQEEQQADLVARIMHPDAQVQQAREARAAIGRMSPEQRAAMGLPAVGWEKVVWGGIGWDEDDPAR